MLHRSVLLGLVLTALTLPVIAQGGASSTRGVALVIGNAAYIKVKALANPVNDATDIGAALKSLGWQVIAITNGRLPAMKQAVRDFGARLDERTPGLFYYAGHGIQVSGVNYLVPVDADIALQAEVADSTLSVDFVLSVMDEKKTPLKMVILDACRDDPFKTSRGGGGTNRGHAVLGKAPTGTVIVYATAPNDVSQDGTGRNGVFTEAFLANLATPGLEFRDIFDRTGESVRSRTGGTQNPWMNSSYYGKLYLVSPAEAESQASARLDSANAELAALKAQQDDLARQLAAAGSQAEKDRLATEGKKAAALQAAKTEEAAALEQMRQLAVSRVAEESKNRAASASRAEEAQAQLASLRDQVAARRASLSTGARAGDMAKASYFRLKSYTDSIAENKKRFDDSLALSLAESEKARSARLASIDAYAIEAWESPGELASRKAEALKIASGDYKREVAALRWRYAEANDRESADLVAAQETLIATVTTQTWPLNLKNLKLSRGDFDRVAKTWVFTVSASEPALSAALVLKVPYSTTAELQKKFTALDAAWTAGAIEARASSALRRTHSGTWEAYLAELSLVQVGTSEEVLARLSPGAPVWIPARSLGTVTLGSLPLIGTVAVAGKAQAVAAAASLSFDSLPIDAPVEIVWKVPEATSLDLPKETISLAEGETKSLKARTGLLSIPYLPAGSRLAVGPSGTRLFEAQKGEAGKTFALVPGTYRVSLRGTVTESWTVHVPEGGTVTPENFDLKVKFQLLARKSAIAKTLATRGGIATLGLASLGGGALGFAASGALYWLGNLAMAEYKKAQGSASASSAHAKAELYATLMLSSLAAGGIGTGLGSWVLATQPNSTALELSIKALDQEIWAMGREGYE